MISLALPPRWEDALALFSSVQCVRVPVCVPARVLSLCALALRVKCRQNGGEWTGCFHAVCPHSPTQTQIGSHQSWIETKLLSSASEAFHDQAPSTSSPILVPRHSHLLHSAMPAFCRSSSGPGAGPLRPSMQSCTACLPAKALQSCPTVCDPIDGSPLNSVVSDSV